MGDADGKQVFDVAGEHIYLPVPKLGEEYTHVECPACDTGEVIVTGSGLHPCRRCGAVFTLRLVRREVKVGDGGDEPADSTVGSWFPRVADMIGTLSRGDRVEIEYIDTRGTLHRKEATVEAVRNHNFTPYILVSADGTVTEWQVGTSISIEYAYAGRGTQTKHLGSVERIRKVEGEGDDDG
jgi:hypothetical protein